MSIASRLPTNVRSASEARAKLGQLEGKRNLIVANREKKAAELEAVRAYLGIADGVETALDKLSEQLFGQVVKILEEQLTKALQEVLDQALKVKVNRDNKRGVATMSFHIERGEKLEDIMKGQGGSVVNVLSVGLRMFALKTLPSDVHRRFLVLDEQDCWLQPALVPKLVKIVHDAGRLLGFQVLMISHHEVSAFEQYADKIYEFITTADGVTVKERRDDANGAGRIKAEKGTGTFNIGLFIPRCQFRAATMAAEAIPDSQILPKCCEKGVHAAMDIGKLKDLKRMLLHDKQLSPIWYFFLDNFGDHSEFHQLGTRIEDPLLESALAHIGQQMLGKPIVVSNLLLARIPGQQFIHGGVFINDCPGGVIYFEDAKIGMASVADLHSALNAKFARFSPQTVPALGEPSKN